MAKTVCKSPKVELGGADVSPWLTGFSWIAEPGTLNQMDITLINTPDVIDIEDIDLIRTTIPGMYAVYKKRILIQGNDIAGYVSNYSIKTSVGELQTITLTVHCDREVLRINDMYPWEEPSDRAH